MKVFQRTIMMLDMKACLTALAITSAASATVLWDGRFNDYSTATDFNKWSWSSQVGTYQTYIYGNLHGESASSWLTLGSQFKNPSTTAEKQGVKVKINSTSTWNGGPMLRTELLPQTTQSLSGHLYFHVSLQIPTVNPPVHLLRIQPLGTACDLQTLHTNTKSSSGKVNTISLLSRVHTECMTHPIRSSYLQGHYADIKYGQLSGQNGVADTLQVITGGKAIWSVTPVKGTWYNFILETGSPGGLWVSTGSSALQKVYTGSLNGNGGTDWHIGALRLPLNGVTQQITETDIYYSGVYVENSGPTTQP
ncbi:hypothetical protein NLI96_g2834 [Meripilus lineatus]|uniref:Glycoside hydrolase 131 catalytic N-terminal domain-containing protein n=1 Tax=Meripilus lineatus TaxID=2056292 RepID=A0AAD5YLM1_9APHY|nr:hypothetical protein NLI96_g2834 [Physisporinus lineatus]